MTIRQQGTASANSRNKNIWTILFDGASRRTNYWQRLDTKLIHGMVFANEDRTGVTRVVARWLVFFSALFFFVFPEISTDGQTYELVYLTRLSSSRACWCAFKTRHHHQNVIIGMRLRCWRSCGGSGLLCFAMVMSTTIVFVWPASAALRKTLADCG